MITQDQRATLQLLLERGQSYADLAALLGEDETAVRARARAALTELVGADPDRNVGLTDYLLGQADPIGRADASRHLREDPDDNHLATELAVRLRLMFPDRRSATPARRGPPDGGRLAAAEHGDGLAARIGRGSASAASTQSQSRLLVICSSAARPADRDRARDHRRVLRWRRRIRRPPPRLGVDHHYGRPPATTSCSPSL